MSAIPLPTFIEALLDPSRYPDDVECVQLLETHISWVLLAGQYAYKIKKPVDFGFLNFSRLALRQFYCQEEIRLNRRLAPRIYLDVVGIGGTPEQPCFGREPAFEYAVKMQRFTVSQTLDNLCARRQLQAAHIDALAEGIAQFHLGLAGSAPDSDHGRAAKVWLPVAENFHHLQDLLPAEDHAVLCALRQTCEAEFADCRETLEQRRLDGMIRECHGDLHLGNIVLLEDRPVPFDGIEFNADLRWIDVISDVAFLVMDLLYRQRADLAYRFLDVYLQITGDYAGLKVLRFYLAYRATVRAKVSALRCAQGGEGIAQDCRDYLALAGRVLAAPTPALIITHGLPGCGKTTVSQSVLETFAAIRLRSDVERKRLFGLQALQRPDPSDDELYTPRASERTYAYLLDWAAQILNSGFPVIVDAAFLSRDERRQFQALAQALAIPFVILHIEAEERLIRQRLQQRQSGGRDASDADEHVYQLLKAWDEPLTADERVCAIEYWNDIDSAQPRTYRTLWLHLASMTGLKPIDR